MEKSPLCLSADIEKKVNMARHQSVASPSVARYAIDRLDLTSLKGDETDRDIKILCAKAMTHSVHSVCIYPDKVKQVADILKDSKIVTATVINFPTGLYRTNSDEEATAETTAEDISKAIAMGAEQVDIVYPYSVNKSEQQYIHDILESARLSCPPQVTLKVILETSAYDNAADLKLACKAALSEKVDCLKTSTGKHERGGATLEAVAIMLQSIKESGQNVGIKITGGVATTEDCAQYIALNKMITGRDKPPGDRFRFGGSKLLDNLLSTINQISGENDLMSKPSSGLSNEY